MVRALLVTLLVHSAGWAQGQLQAKVEAIQGLMPAATSCVILWSPQSSPELQDEFGLASSETGLRIIQTPINSLREMSGVLKALSPYSPDFILMLSDRMVTGKNAVKFVVRAYHRQSIPVFVESDDAISGGAYGALVLSGSQWKIKINGEVRADFPITPPEGDDRYTVSN